MITKLIYGIGDAFEAFFTILPTLGPFVNFLIISTGVIATVGWIWYMFKSDSSGKAQ